MFLLDEQLPQAYFISFILILFGFIPVSYISSFAVFSTIFINSSFVYRSDFSFSISCVFNFLYIQLTFFIKSFSISSLLIYLGAVTITAPFPYFYINIFYIFSSYTILYFFTFILYFFHIIFPIYKVVKNPRPY